MVILRLKGPKGGMVKSTPAATAARRKASKRKPSGDTIEVKRRLATVSISENDESVGTRTGKRRSNDSRTSTGEPNGSRGAKGKLPNRPPLLENFDSDDTVEEYVFSSDEDLDEDDENIDDVRSIITLSSECSGVEEDIISLRPWKEYDIATRKEWERMYAEVKSPPLGGNWEATEDYQREKDAEMLRYIEDFPLSEWIIPQEEANEAYFRLLARTRWRTLGIPIYTRDRVPEWVLGNTNAPQTQYPLHMPPGYVPHEQRPNALGPGEVPPGGETQHVHESGVPPISGTDGAPHSGPIPQQPLKLYPTEERQQHPHHQQPQQIPQQHPILHQHPYGSFEPHLIHAGNQVPYQAHPGVYHSGFNGPPPGPHGVPLGFPGPHLPPPPHPLPSQPYAQPIAVPPGPIPPTGMGHPIGPAQQMQYPVPTYPAQPHPIHGQGHFPPPAAPKPRRGREKKESPTTATATPPPPPPTPPYELRQKPVDKKGPKAGRRSARRQAEAEEFPWTRNLNFREEKEKASWNDDVYDPETLIILERTRARNVAVIDELDAKVQEQQRLARAAKKNKDKKGDHAESSDTEPPKPGEKKKMQRGQRKIESHGDPYHSGAFAFASDDDEQRAADLGYKTPDEALEAGEAGEMTREVQASIKIYWNPGKKGMTENLEQIKFTIKDTLVTRTQLRSTPILTSRAAECIVDFCPDMLWRGMLLRICSEAGYGNKDVRDRFCYNGCYCDKATITKRISAALGQKQVQPKSKGYGPGEWEWYDENVKDFAKYIDFFGKRTSHRNMLKIQMQGEKRKMKQREAAGLPVGASDEEKAGPSKKRAKSAPLNAESEDVGGEDGEGGNDSDGSEDSNVVSIQDSDILDKMED